MNNLKITRVMMLVMSLTCSMAIMAGNGVTDEKENQNTPSGWPAVALPILPAITSANTITITDNAYGASTASTDNTKNIQAALNAVPSTGGMVVIPSGTFLCGPLTIKSKTILHFNEGAVLKLLPYGTYPPKKVNFISNVNNSTDIVIEGKGTIDGQGEAWWKALESNKSLERGAVIRFGSGSRFLVKEITVKNAPGVNITIGQSGNGTDGTVHDVTISAPSSSSNQLENGQTQVSHNTDGIPVWAARVNIYNCNISNGDDNVVIDSDGQYVHVWNCNFGYGHGASIGSYTERVHDVLFDGITFSKTDSGCRLKSQHGRSGSVYNITWQNCTMTGVNNPVYIDCWYDFSTKPGPSSAPKTDSVSTTPYFHDILIKNVTSTGTSYNSSPKSYFPVYIYGLPESYCANITFDNVNISAQKGMFLAFIRGLKFINNCNIKNTKTPSERISSSYNVSMTGLYNGTEKISNGVDDVFTYQYNNASAKKYNLAGQMVNDTYHGIVIENGKKKIQK